MNLHTPYFPGGVTNQLLHILPYIPLQLPGCSVHMKFVSDSQVITCTGSMHWLT